MRRSLGVIWIWLACSPLLLNLSWGQIPASQQSPPPETAQKPPPPDPTKDPAKEPLDLTKDPTKSSDPQVSEGSADPAKSGSDSVDVAPEAPDYTGPAILSRGYAISRPAVPVNEHLRFFAGLNANYDSGLLGAYDKNGSIPPLKSGGADINWGASARHYRKKDIIDFTYSGHYYQYLSHSKFSAQDHSFAGGYTRQFSPKLTIGVRETAGLYSNTYSVLNSTAISDTSLASSTIVVAPNTESFDDRTYYSTTSGSVTFQKTARLSFSLGGSYFLVKRASNNLADNAGYQASGDISYRITKRQSLGVYYAHSGYSYKKIFGDSNADSFGANYSISLSRNMDLALHGGATRYDAQTLAFVVPNPLVQQVLGIQVGIEKFYFVGFAPDLTAALTRRLRRSSIGLTFTEGITPGNGLVLTSKRQSESVSWNLPTFRKSAVQVGAGRDILSGYTTGPGHYASYFARISMSRPITKTIGSYFNVDYRQFGFGGTSFHQTEYRLSMGFRFSPGEGPIKFW